VSVSAEFEVEEFNKANDRIKGTSPKFISEGEVIGGQNHSTNSAALRIRAAEAARLVAEENKKGMLDQTAMPRLTSEFGQLWALSRDYRTRYGSPVWRRWVGIRGRRQASVLRGAVIKYAE
jgi:hypothetical protein